MYPYLINAQNDYGHTPLMLAAGNKDIALVDILLEFNPDLEITDNHGNNVSIYTQQNNEVGKVIREKVEKYDKQSRERNQKLEKMWFELTNSKPSSHTPNILPELKRLLEEKPSLVNTKNKDGITGLFTAVMQGNLKVLDFLLQYDPDLNILDSKGKNVFDYANGESLAILSRHRIFAFVKDKKNDNYV